jgi:hypothetical protein
MFGLPEDAGITGYVEGKGGFVVNNQLYEVDGTSS